MDARRQLVAKVNVRTTREIDACIADAVHRLVPLSYVDHPAIRIRVRAVGPRS